MAIAALVISWGLWLAPAHASLVVKFYDGDNLVLIQGGIKTKVSLACIDAPELKQIGGQNARKALKSLVDGKQISLRIIAKDKIGRLVAEIFAGAKNVNKTLLEHGYVHFNGQYRQECDQYASLEAIAKQNRVGIWHDGLEAELPSKFRQEGY